MKTIATILIYSPWGLTELSRKPSDGGRHLTEHTESETDVRRSDRSNRDDCFARFANVALTMLASLRPAP